MSDESDRNAQTLKLSASDRRAAVTVKSPRCGRKQQDAHRTAAINNRT